mgnify:CR=1 FL=1
MPTDLSIILPPAWAQVYLSPARFLRASLADLGLIAELAEFDAVATERPAILLGWNLYPAEWRPTVRYAVYQLEPLSHEYWRGQFAARRGLFVRANALWDYSTHNLDWLAAQGLEGKWLPLTYHPELCDISTPNSLSEYDILFTGVLTPRRQAVIEALTRRCCVYAHSRWGSELVDAISRSKIVLNIHQHDELMPLEQVRVAYALNQGAFVLSEESADEPFPFLPHAPYAALAERALELLFRPAVRATAHVALCKAFEQSRTLAHLEAALAPLLPI